MTVGVHDPEAACPQIDDVSLDVVEYVDDQNGFHDVYDHDDFCDFDGFCDFHEVHLSSCNPADIWNENQFPHSVQSLNTLQWSLIVAYCLVWFEFCGLTVFEPVAYYNERDGGY